MVGRAAASDADLRAEDDDDDAMRGVEVREIDRTL